MIGRPAIVTTMVAILAVSVGCVGNRMYRIESVETTPNYTLSYVEFDDAGEMWAPSQLERAVAQVEQANETNDGCVFILFIHGWQHNASQKEEEGKRSNVAGFKQMLDMIGRYVSTTEGKQARKVVGVYLGWRGLAAKFRPLKPFTFWGRFQTARHIAGISGTEAVYRLTLTAKANPRSTVILAGHSFGGLILENTLSQALVGHLAQDPEQQGSFPADLVILINPATPSIWAKQLVDMMDRYRVKLNRKDLEGSLLDRPLVVSVTSIGDSATRVMFPFGLTIGTLFVNMRKYGDEYCNPVTKQKHYILHTPGHTKALHSHAVEAVPLDRVEKGAAPPGLAPLNLEAGPFGLAFDGAEHRYAIEKRLSAYNDTPYWIMRVPTSLIPDHSDIFRRDLVHLIRALLAYSGALRPDLETILVRESGIEPLAVVAMPDGDVVFLDRSRRLYVIPKDESTPVFLSCAPTDLSPGESIGSTEYEGKIATTVNYAVKGAKKGHFRTEIVELSVADDVVETKRTRLDATTRFRAASADFARNRLYLATEDEVFVTDLRHGKRKPRLLAALDVLGEGIVDIKADTVGNMLFVNDAGGRVHLVEPSMSRAPVIAGEGIGSPASSAIDSTRGRVYISDLENRSVWKVSCTADGACATPEVFVSSDDFRAPVHLSTATDGTLWIGDPVAHTIFAVDPEGEIRRTVR
jgi:hypothetical protein